MTFVLCAPFCSETHIMRPRSHWAGFHGIYRWLHRRHVICSLAARTPNQLNRAAESDDIELKTCFTDQRLVSTCLVT